MKKTLFLILVFSNSFLALADEEILNFIKKYHLYDSLYLVNGKVNKDDLNVTHLDKITSLNCSGGDFTTVPKSIDLLKSLSSLDLSNSSLEELPTEINTLTNLTTLYLNNNRLKKLPNIENLTNLKEVYLNYNNLVEVPKGIENICSSFKNNFRMPPPNRPCILDISNNRLSYLPKEIANIEGFGCGYIEDSNISLKILNNFYTKIPNSFKDIEFQTTFPNDYSYACRANTKQLGYEFFDLEIAYNFETNKSISFKPILGDDLEVTDYLWLFGDDINSTEKNPTHTYEEFGDYNVTLILSHYLNDGKEYKAFKTIHIYPRVKEFKKGWNLVTTPTTDDINRTLFDKVWSYKDYTWHRDDKFLTPTKGYWVKAKSDFNISFNGNSYPLFDSKIRPGWNLLGSGEKMTTFDKSLTYYVYRCNCWVKNPKEISAGEGVWIYKPLTPQDRLVKFLNNQNGGNVSVNDLEKTYKIEFSSIDYLPPEIEYLKNLQYLSIGNSNIKELPKELFNLTKLVYLHISTTKLEKIPKEIGKLVNLEELSIYDTKIEELPEEMENLKKLRYLSLYLANITTLGNISKIKNLKQLRIGASQFKELNGIGNLTNLVELGLPYNKIEELPSEIGELLNLENLHLSSNLIKELPNEVANLIKLKYLTLTMNKLKEFPKEITKLINLEALSIDRNEIPEIPAEIKNLKKLESFYAYSNKLNSLPDEIGNLSSLSRLLIGDNNITKIPDKIGNLSSIKTLTLSKCQIETISDSIYNLKTLESLYLDNNKLTTLSSKIGNLTDLESLNLSGNPLQELPSEISNLSNLKLLYLRETPFSNGEVELPEEIKNMPSLNLRKIK